MILSVYQVYTNIYEMYRGKTAIAHLTVCLWTVVLYAHAGRPPRRGLVIPYLLFCNSQIGSTKCVNVNARANVSCLSEQQSIYASRNKPVVCTCRVTAGNNRNLGDNEISALPPGVFDGMVALEKL